jgi:hypothetical protein
MREEPGLTRLIQLKATAYDILAEIERLQHQLREVNQAILEESQRQARTSGKNASAASAGNVRTPDPV